MKFKNKNIRTVVSLRGGRSAWKGHKVTFGGW